MATGLRTYPDGAIYCEKIEFDHEDSERDTATNPTVIFEVLSKGTEAHDRGFRFDNFRQIPSLKAYVLASQQAAHVEVFERQPDNSWALRDYRGIDAIALIPGPKIDLPLREVYDRVDFSTPA
jgi:Uma2 family endonuclease